MVRSPRHGQVIDHLAGLPTAFRDKNDAGEEAKRFDRLALRLRLAVANGEPGFIRLRDQVQEIASTSLDQLTIPTIKAQRALLDEVAADERWQDVTLPLLETMRRRLRGLVRLTEKTKRGVVTTLGAPYSQGEELWKLAEHLGDRTTVHEQARWILTQASRARMTATGDRPRTPWTAAVHRRHTLATLYANHDTLLTGRMTLLED